MRLVSKWQFIASFILALLINGCQQEPETASATNPSVTSTDNTPSETTSSDISEPTLANDSGCVLSMGYDPWEPYHFDTADQTVRGIDVEIVQAMATDSGCTVRFVPGQWLSLLNSLKSGEIDILPGATAVEERESYAWFSIPYRSEQFELYVSPEDELPSTELTGLLNENFRIGLTDGYIYGEPLSSAQNNDSFSDQFIYAPIAAVNFTNLADSRINGFIEDPFVATAIIRRHGWHDRVRATGIMVSTQPTRLMFSKATVSEVQVRAFNTTLSLLKRDGRDEEIFKRYLGVSNN